MAEKNDTDVATSGGLIRHGADSDSVSNSEQPTEQTKSAFDDSQMTAAGTLVTAALPSTQEILTTTDIEATPDVIPSDSMFGSQWHLNNNSNPRADLNVTEVWDDYQGNGVVVGIMDTGIDYLHPDLAANYRHDLDHDARDSDYDSYASASDDNHGTAAAGMIAGAINGSGSVGVAPEADITGFRIGFGSGPGGQIANQFQNATNVDVLNNSWGYGGYFYDDFNSSTFASERNAIANLAANGRGGLGTIITFSAGNSGSEGDNVNYHSFSNSPYTIAVGATGSSGNLAYFSTPGAAVLTSAPGQSVVTTDRTGSAGYGSSNYTTINGTSFSSPAVAGVVALMLDANPLLGYRDVQEILAYSSRNPTTSTSGWRINGADNWNGGGLSFTDGYGFGIADAHAAVRLAETWTLQSVQANVDTVSYSSSPNAFIADNSTVTDTIFVSSGLEIDHVLVDINIAHTWIGDLTVTLRSPDGTVSTLVDRPGVSSGSTYGTSQNDIRFTLDSVQYWGEQGQGSWQLSVSDSVTQDPGILENWTLTLLGDTISSDDTYIYTDDFALYGGGSGRQSISDTNGGTDTLNLAAVTTAINLDLTAGSNNTLFGRSLNIAGGTLIENAFGGDAGDTISGNDANNTISGIRGAETLSGGLGDDVLIGGAGDDHLFGGDGIDTVVFSGLASDYTINMNGATVTVTALSGNNGTDSLVDVEFAQFDDQSIAVHAAITANDDSITASEDIPLTIDASALLANDEANDPTSLNVTSVFGAQHGTVQLIGGQIVYTASSNFSGADSFTYVIEDGTGLNDSATVSVDVTPVADLPTLGFSLGAMSLAGSGLTVDAALNVTSALVDLDGSESLSITLSGLPDFAVLSAGQNNGDGSFTLTPDQLDGLILSVPVSGSSQFDLNIVATATEAANGATTSATQTVNIDLSSVPVAPIALGPTASMAEDTSISGRLRATDFNNDPLTFALGQNAAHGTVTVNPDGTYIYTPNADYTGNDSFTFIVDDGAGGSDTATYSVFVRPVNDAPVQIGTPTFTTDEDSSVPITSAAILAQVNDVDGDTLSVAGVSANSGTIVNNGDGTWTFTPDAEFSGTVSLTYQVTDGVETIAVPGTVSVVAVNDAPVSPGDAVSVLEDGSLSGTLTATDAEGDAFTFSLATGAANGTVSLDAAGNYTYTPDSNFSGQDSFTYAITDTGGAASTATVSIDVTPVADTPTVISADASGTEDTSIALAIGTALGDADGSEVISSATISGIPTGASLSAGIDNGDGSWLLSPADLTGLSITPPADFNGSFDLTIAVTAAEVANGATSTAATSLTINVSAVNDAPSGDTLAFVTERDSGVNGTLTATDADGDAFTFGVGVNPTHGAVTINGDRSFLYTPTRGFFGTDSFTYSITDIHGAVGTASATVTINEPTGLVSGSTDSSDALTGTDTDDVLYGFDGDDTLSGGEGSDELRGGTGADVLEGGAGDDRYVFEIGDGLDTISDNATVHVTEVQRYWAPSGYWGTSGEDVVWVNTGQWRTRTVVTTYDSDAGDDILEFGSGIALNDVALQLSGGDLTIEIDSNTPGPSLQAVGGAPYGDQVTIDNWTRENEKIETLRLSSGVDLDISDLESTIQASSTLGGEQLTGDEGNNWISSGAGADTLIGAAGDDILIGGGGTDTAVFSGLVADYTIVNSSDYLTVTDLTGEDGSDTLAGIEILRFADGSAVIENGNFLPNLVTKAFAANEDGALTISAADILAGANDIDGGTLSLAAVHSATNGSVALDGNGDVVFTPDTDYHGSAGFSFTVSDGQGGLSTANATVAIAAVADAPILTAGAVNGAEDSQIALDIQSTLTDADGSENLSVTISGIPTGATLSAGTDNGSGTWMLAPADLTGLTITPPANFNGSFNLNVTAISTEASNTDTATSTTGFTVNVTPTNDGPSASDDSLGALENTPLSIAAATLLANDSDIDGDTLSIASVGTAVGGVAVLEANGDVTFTPDAGYSGTASFDYTVSDGSGGTSVGSVTVTVAAAADTPSLTVTDASGSEDTSIALDVQSALADTDGSETLSVTLSGVPSGAVLSAGTNNGNGTWTLAPGDLAGLQITPAADFNGSFDLGVTAVSTESSGGDTAAAAATLRVTVSAVNDAPVAVGGIVLVAEDIAHAGTLSANDVDGDTLSFALETAASNGTVSVSPDGSFSYTPNNGFNGSDSFSYTVSDGAGGSSSATVSLTVAPLADTPSLSVSDASGTEDTSIALDVQSALTDTDGSETLSVTVSGVPWGASLSAGVNNGDGTWTLSPGDLAGLRITPAANFNGSFDLGVTSVSTETSNGDTASAAATLTVVVGAANDAPDAVSQSVLTDRDTEVAGQLSASDVDGDTLSFTLAAAASSGTALVNPDGTFTYTPQDGFFGTDSFTFTVSDGAGGSVTETVTVTVAAPGSLLAGTSGDDTLTGDADDEVLYGGGGNDALYGEGGADELRGGAGTDWLYGGGGDDVYVFSRGDGLDTISDNATTQESTTTRRWVNSGYWASSGEDTVWVNTGYWQSSTTWYTVEADAGNDVLSFGSGIELGDIALDLRGGDLEVEVQSDAGAGAQDVGGTPSSDRVTIANWTDEFDRLETLRFSDGSEIDITGLQSTVQATGTAGGETLQGSSGQDWIASGAGGDTLIGGGGDDILIGGDGDDYLVGSEGSDTYQFSRGDGNDTLNNLGSDAASTDRLVFDSDIASDQLWFTRTGNDLDIQIVGTNDHINLTDWYNDTDKRIDSVEAGDGAVLVEAQVQQLVDAMASFSPPTGTDINLADDVQDQLQSVLGDAWSSS